MSLLYPFVFAMDGNRRFILRSDDKRANWFLFADLSALEGSAKFLDSSPTFAVHPTNPNVIFALDAQHDIMKVTYNPNFDPTKPASKLSLNSFAALPSWMPAGVKTFNQVRKIGIDPVDPNVMYVSMLVSGIPSIYRTLNGGQTWASISDDLNYQGGCVVVNPHTRQVFKGSMSGTSIYPAPSTNGVELIHENQALRVYYDSKNQQLTVLGALPTNSFQIFDIMGRLVTQFTGASTSISALSEGVYFLSDERHKSTKFVK